MLRVQRRPGLVELVFRADRVLFYGRAGPAPHQWDREAFPSVASGLRICRRLVTVAASGRCGGVGWGLWRRLVGAGPDCPVGFGEDRKRRGGQVFDESGRGLRQGFVEGTDGFPVAASSVESTFVLGDGPFDRLDDLKEGDLGGRAGEGIAAGGPGLGVEDMVADQLGEDLGRHVSREIHGGADLAAGSALGLVAGEIEESPDGVVGLFGEHDSHEIRIRELNVEYSP